METPYRCLVIDDETEFVDELREYIDQHARLQWVGSCDNRMEAIGYLQQGIDIWFLDIEWGPRVKQLEQAGLDFLMERSQEGLYTPYTIISSKYGHHVHTALSRNQVIDFLHKPFGYERFCTAVDRAIRSLDLARLQAQSQQQKLTVPGRIVLPVRDETQEGQVHHIQKLVSIDDIAYVWSKGGMVFFRFRYNNPDTKTYVTGWGLPNFIAALAKVPASVKGLEPGSFFYQVNENALVNLLGVSDFKHGGLNQVQLTGDVLIDPQGGQNGTVRLDVSRNRSKGLQTALGNLFPMAER